MASRLEVTHHPRYTVVTTAMESPRKAPKQGAARRVIARLDIKHPQGLVKGIQLEGFRVVGDPGEAASRYYEDGIDELVYMDMVASLYGRNSLTEVVAQAAERIFVPLTVGGGIRKVDDIYTLLRAGADKVALNTAAIARPELLSESVRAFGSQCITISIEAKRVSKSSEQPSWEAYTDNGRERTGLDAIEWIRKACDLGVGEVLVTSVDRDGTKKGFDRELIAKVAPHVRVPLVVCGGAGTIAHITEAFESGADGVGIASLLHYKTETVSSIKKGLLDAGIQVRA